MVTFVNAEHLKRQEIERTHFAKIAKQAQLPYNKSSIDFQQIDNEI